MRDLNTLSRREVLSHTAALAACASLPACTSAQQGIGSKAIPGTDEQLPLVGLGSPDFFYRTPEGGTNEAATALVQTLYDAGGRMIDTPAFFRPDPPVLGGILQDLNLQDEMFLISKLTIDGREAGMERLDAIIMPSFSMYRPQIEERILPLAADMGVAVIAIEVFKTRDDGHYFRDTADKELPEWAAEFDCESWAQFALKFVLGHPAVTCSAVETSRPEHLLDNLGGGHGRLPDQAMRMRMKEHFLSLS